MAITATFNQNLKLALETDRGVSPSGLKLGKQWWTGGRWFDIVTDGLPSIQDKNAIIFPAGHAGDRRINQQAPAQGRAWSEGDFSAPVVADWLAPILYGAMGAASTDMVPSFSAASLLLPAEIFSANKSFVLNNQPTNGGNFFRFELTGASVALNATISMSGIDTYGNGASELITVTSEGLVYSRTSWSSIGASGINIVAANGAGKVAVLGIQHFKHTFTAASVAPTFSFERSNNPTRGEASANNSFMNVGMVLRQMTLTNNAESNDGIFMASADFEGDPTGSSTTTTINSPSVMRIWPSWTQRIRRDNGTQWDVVQSFDLTHTTGNRVYRAAAGVRNPQGAFYGATEISGKVSILLNNELEFKKWDNASEIQLHSLWTSPWKTGASNMQISASIPCYIENATVEDSNGAWVLSADFRIVRNDNFAYAFSLLNGVPGTGIGLTTSI